MSVSVAAIAPDVATLTETLEATIQGLQHTIRLARIAIAYGDTQAAAADIVGAVDDLGPELEVLRCAATRD